MARSTFVKCCLVDSWKLARFKLLFLRERRREKKGTEGRRWEEEREREELSMETVNKKAEI